MFCLALLLVAICNAAPLPPKANNLSTPVPIGQYYGGMTISPYHKSGSAFQCTNCAVTSETYLFFDSSSLMLNISGASNGGCTVYRQGYYFYNLAPHSGGAYPYYYTATGVVEGGQIPVCLRFDGNILAIVLDGQGTCPPASSQASCTSGWTPGTVAQTWVGSFSKSVIPTGTWSGSISIVPYQQSGPSHYSCLNCYPVTTAVTFNWRGDQMSITINAGSSGGCSVNSQSYLVSQVVDYGASYPNYFQGLTVMGGYQYAICFYWDASGTVIFKFDGQGTCPSPSEVASCQNASPGAVTQVWTAAVRPKA